MTFTYENQGTNTYLVYKVGNEDSLDTMSLGMLTNNKIPGFAPTFFTQMDTVKYLKYNVTAHISVRQFFSGPVNKKRLLGVLNGIVNAMISAEDFMIDSKTVLLDLDYIFADVSTCNTVLICLPIVGATADNVDMGSFFKNIMFSTQFDQTENCDHVAKIMNYLNSTPVFSLDGFKKLLNNIEFGNDSQPQPPTPNKPVVSNNSQPNMQPRSNAPQRSSAPAQPFVAQQNRPVSVPTANSSYSAVPPKNNFPINPATKRNPMPQQPAANYSGQRPTGFSVPQKATPSEEVQSENGEKKITLIQLLSHYNKENAAAYKAQKAQAKQSKTSKSNADSRPTAFRAPVAPNAAPATAANSAVPKQSGYAIPGRSNMNVGASNGSFAVPGQPKQNMNPPVKKQITPVNAQTANQPAFAANSAPTTQQSAGVQESINGIQQPHPSNGATLGSSMNFGETTVLNGGNIGETTVLGATNGTVQTSPKLVRAKNNEIININKPVFRIGKEKSYVDYFIGDNSAISRSHANIITRDGEYFVVDTNSTNHTYLNGSMIRSNVETKLTHGDRIKFANEDFEFKLY